MLYQVYELQRLGLEPMRIAASGALQLLEMRFSLFPPTSLGRIAAAALDSFEDLANRPGKAGFDLPSTADTGAIAEEVIASNTWCELRRFRSEARRPHDPRLLIVAPMSGHHATLLRGTVEAFVPDHDVHITDWRDARAVPLASSEFDLDEYIDYVIAYLRLLGPDTHVIAVCQPAVPVLAAVALMSAADDPATPRSMTLIGGPIDTRVGETEVNRFAKRHSLDWFRSRVIHRVPFGYPGFMRDVYPGFLQLAGFMAMNLDRHVHAHWQMFLHLVAGDGETLAAKRAFYREYRAVMDLPAPFYLQTIDTVFQRHLLPQGKMVSRGRKVDLAAIERTALLTIEGERDDISGIGQTRAAHALCDRLPAAMHEHAEQRGVGHYGLFNGRRFREEIAPRIKRFIAAHR